jgi:hypothetical protein
VSTLQSQQQQAIEVDDDQEDPIGAGVLQELVEQLAGPVAEVIGGAHRPIYKVSQAHHAEDVDQREHHDGKHVPR